MSTPTFADTHNMVAFLDKPAESDGFHEIIDFLNANQIRYALNIQALIDKKKLIITETSIRSDLHLEDARGTDCLPTATIFEKLVRMGAKSTAWNEFSSTMASLIICLATNQRFNLSKYIFDAMVKHLDGGVKFLMYLRFLQVFINQQLGDMSHHKKIFVNPSHTKKIFANMKREGKDFSGRITPLFETMMVQPTQDEGVDSGIPADSLQTPITHCYSLDHPLDLKRNNPGGNRGRTLHVPTPSNDPPLSGEDSMQLSELMLLCTNLQKQVLDLEKAKDAQAKEIADLKKRVQRLERKKKSRTTGLKRLKKVGMSRRVESSKDQESLGDHEDASKQGRSIEDIDKDADVSLVDDTQGRSDDANMFDIDDLHGDEVNMDMPVGENQEQSVKEREVDTSVEDKGKGMIEPEVPLKRKDQVALDEDLARNLQAQLEAKIIEEEKLAMK
ncbi:hypothetical protein Tco_0425978 [Tanacetum coccineum]